ncbi:MAG: hypothetical protein Q7T00_04930 [Rugosibacter sp.]|nr:hypothetical protein [Rugosibacter sp.]
MKSHRTLRPRIHAKVIDLIFTGITECLSVSISRESLLVVVDQLGIVKTDDQHH